MKILFNIIATGKYYDLYALPLIQSLKDKTFLSCKKDFLVFSDNKKLHGADNYIAHFPMPINTLMRFYYMCRFVEFYKKYDYVYYIDSDMLVNNIIYDDLLPDDSGLVGVEHPLQKRKLLGERPTFETNEHSLAYFEEQKNEVYFQGCLFGGTSIEFINLIQVLNTRTNIDLGNNLIARWWDESHLNWYFNTVSFPKVLSSDYCYPEAFPNLGLSPKILHLDKNR